MKKMRGYVIRKEVIEMNLFSRLSEMRLIEEWVPVLDWLLDDSRFSAERGWNQQKKTSFTNEVKKRFNNWIITKLKDATWEPQPQKTHYVKMTKDGSVGESFVRHIRNGIAHGNTEIVRQRQDENKAAITLLKIYDYKISKGTQNQTAYIKMPVNELVDIYKLYIEIQEKGMESTSKKAKSA